MTGLRLFRLCLILAVALIWVAGGLTGCSGKRKDLRAGIRTYHQLPSLPDEIKAEKDLPKEMTSDDYERLGDVYLSKDNLYMAFVKYEKALQISPENTRVLYKKGLTFLIAKKNKEAIKEFRALIKKDPGYALAYEGMGQSFFQMKKHDEARRYFQKAIKLNPELWKAHAFLGVLYDQQKKYALAIQEYDQAIQLRPGEGFLYNNLGVSYSFAGKYKEAIIAFYKALQRNYSTNRVYNNLGVVLSKLAKYEEALDAFRKAGNETQAYNNLGCIYMGRGDFEQAVSCFEKAIDINPVFYVKANENLERARMALIKGERVYENKTNKPSEVSEQYTLQIASLDNELKAANLAERLNNRGHPAYYYKVNVKGKTYYRVRCGIFNNKEEANDFQRLIAKQERIKGFITKIEK